MNLLFWRLFWIGVILVVRVLILLFVLVARSVFVLSVLRMFLLFVLGVSLWCLYSGRSVGRSSVVASPARCRVLFFSASGAASVLAGLASWGCPFRVVSASLSGSGRVLVSFPAFWRSRFALVARVAGVRSFVFC